MNYKIKLALLFVMSFSGAFAQEVLTKQQAVEQALESNFGIKIANNSTKIAKNNASIYNSGYLPRFTANAGANYSLNNTELTNRDGSSSEIKDAESKSYNASLGLNYTLFDGLGRSYNFKRLKETYNLSQLEAQTIIENALLQIFTIYYEVARLTENNKNLLQTLSISKQRLERLKYGFEYGQSTKLQLLNAEVDVNNDSIRYFNEQRLLANAKRDLNLLLGREINQNFTVDTNVQFLLAFDYPTLIEKAKIRNVEIQKIEKNIELSNFDLKINKSDLLPTLNLSSSYGYTNSRNDASIFTRQEAKGFNAGVNLSWNLFDGGTTKTRIQNAKIVSENLQIQQEQIEKSLERNVANALEVYNNALFILKSEEKNVETNTVNFQRTEEQFKLGQITSIEFRQAQVNLLNAQSSLNQAKFDAKNAELFLIQLTGDLLNYQF
jgi:outer membrane protein TolC